MCQYLGIDPVDEPDLIDIAKAAVIAPLPPGGLDYRHLSLAYTSRGLSHLVCLSAGWEEFEDNDGTVRYLNKHLELSQPRHPLDGYFFELMLQARDEMAQHPVGAFGV